MTCRTRKTWIRACTVGWMTLLAGCQTTPDRVMRQNYDHIQEQISTKSEVSTLLGTPQHRIGDTWMYSRPDQHLTVIVDFDANGHVTRKQWIDGENATWDDSSDPD